jgi:hypothetical protein
MKEQTIKWVIIIIGLLLFFKFYSGCSVDPDECETVSISLADNIIASTGATWKCYDSKVEVAREKIEELLDDKGCIKMTGEIHEAYEYSQHLVLNRSGTNLLYGGVSVEYSFKGLDKSEYSKGDVVTLYGRVANVEVSNNGQSGTYSSGGILNGLEKCSQKIRVNITNSGILESNLKGEQIRE